MIKRFLVIIRIILYVKQNYNILTLGEDIFKYTTVGANEVFANCEG